MFKSKIAVKLSVYFAIALLVFAIIIGSVFGFLFRNNTLEINKNELESQAVNIAKTLPNYLNKSGGGMGGFGMYLRMIGDAAATDVWIVDQELNLVTGGRGQGQMLRDYRYDDLPENAEGLVHEVFTGKTTFSEDFSDLLSELTLTVGAPIFNSGGDVIGVVLLHSPVRGINQGISQGIRTLVISIVLALAASILLSIIFSVSFTKPLAIMKKTALHLANGDYSVKTKIKQKDEIGELAETLDVLADRLDAASHESEKLEAMRREFVANVSHELKTPVTVMRGSLEALVDKVVTDPVKVEAYHIQMLKESKFLQRLVGDLLDLSRLQSLDFAIEKKEISMGDILEDVMRSVEPLAKKRDIDLVMTKEEGQYKILGDYGRVRQMMMIILDNAIKFSPKNEKVDIILENNKLYIKDKGVGISLEDLPYIFDRFYKSRSEENKTGTGLGLAIAKQIADRHGIKLRAESIEGQGATFIFSW